MKNKIIGNILNNLPKEEQVARDFTKSKEILEEIDHQNEHGFLQCLHDSCGLYIALHEQRGCPN
jgi:hypothetical protein